jgi:predicted nuclease of restriction endonuclease-like (RecB) superfamily
MNNIQTTENKFIAELKQIVSSARRMAYSAINFAQVKQNWLIGQRIVEEEQNGKARAEYGKHIIELASKELTTEFGRGFSKTNLKNFRQFFLTFSDFQIGQTLSDLFTTSIGQTMPDQLTPNWNLSTPSTELETNKKGSKAILPILSWSHYERLLRVTNKDARLWYMNEAAQEMWSYRTLDRNISTLYYERLLASQKKDIVETEMKEKTSNFQQNKLAFIKNPSVIEFLGLPSNVTYTENALEQAIIDQMQKFLLELGKGFSFVARQQLVRTETQDFYIDLVFYNYILKCFVIVELKTHSINHQDIGQLDMYVRMYDDLKRGENDNPTIGILLCTETDKTIAQYSVLKENKQLFASKYIPYLPTEKELADEIERQKEIFMLQQANKEGDAEL